MKQIAEQERKRCISILVRRAKHYHRSSRKGSLHNNSRQYSMFCAVMMAAREIKENKSEQITPS